jgi:hypothetical protein
MEFKVSGIPLTFAYDASGFYVSATYQNVTINGSPLVFYFDPPVADQSDINAPALLLFLLGALANGAVIG